MSARIRIDHGQDAGKVWRLPGPGSYIIGRDPSISIRVLDMKVSKAHCRIVVQGEGATSRAILEDLKSTHGTELNGQPVSSPKQLKPGDEIRLGLSILRFLSDGAADEDAVPHAAKNARTSVAVEDKAAGTAPKRRKTFAADSLVGKDIGGYLVREKIGQGGMGSVYTAEQVSLHRDVALKVLSEKFTSDRNFVDQFVNEARSAAALNHPNVVQVYDVGKEDGRYYFSMEFVLGGSLEERLAEDGKASWQDALNWMMDAANALIFAQKRDILHRDVKPDNLMLAEDGSAKLCDLGLAKKSANEDMLAAGIIGTPAFISPEAIQRRKDIDARSDLYSLGCTFYRLLTGENPYPGKTVKEILVGHLRGAIPRVSDKNPDVPRALDDAIYKLMQKEPADRFESPQELLQALDKIRIQHGLEAHGIRPSSRKPLVFAAVVVLLAIGAVGYLLTRPKNDAPTGPTPEEIARDKERERKLAEQQYTIFRDNAEGQYKDLELERISGRLGIDNWMNDSWTTLIGKYESLATDLTQHPDYGQREEILATAAKASAGAKTIRDGVKVRRGLDKVIKQGREARLGALDAATKAHRKLYDDALRAGQWFAAAAALDPAAIEDVVRPFRDAKITDILPDDVPTDARKAFEDEPLLDPAARIDPLVAKLFPGEPIGSDLLPPLLAAMDTAHESVTEKVKAALEQGNAEGFAQARKLAQDYVDALPAIASSASGPVADRLRTQLAEGKRAVLMAKREAAQLLKVCLAEDRLAYHKLLRNLRSPEGLFFRGEYTLAKAAALAAVMDMRESCYEEVTEALASDAAALEALLDKIVTSYPDGWTGTKVEGVDDRGRTTSERVRAITKQSVKLGSDEVPLASLGPAWLLNRLLFPSDEEPRIALEGNDQRAIALLAEMAVDYDRVVKAYQSYLASPEGSDPKVQASIRWRMGRLGKERRAAEAWRTAITRAAEVQTYLDQHDPALIGDESFREGGKAKELLENESTLNRLLTEARDAEATLLDPALADTIWAAVLRETPAPTARYADEPVVEDVPVDEPTPPTKKEDTPPDEGAPPKDAPDGE